MPPTYEELEPTMDAQVENRLGDSISYSLAGAPPKIIRGFINIFTDEGAIEGGDPIKKRWYVEINRTLLPRPPSNADRITHPKLDGTYKPSTSTLSGGNTARDYVFGLQKA